MSDNWRSHEMQPIGAFLPKIKEPKMSDERPMTSSYVPIEGKGRIKKNYKKEEGDKRPDMMGEMMYKGEIIKFGVWERESQYGKYYTISVNDPNWKDKQYPKDITPREPRKMAGDVPW